MPLLLRGNTISGIGSHLSKIPCSEMSLTYNTPQYSATETSYTGNITEWSWKYGPGDTENTYAFTYDKLSRLTDTKQYVNGAVSDLFVEKNLSYDRNGNIRTLNRTETGELFHAFSYGYTGNQLTTLSDGAADYAYAYDRNGNMTNDGMNGLKVVYNRLNLIEKVLRGDTILVKYSYLSDGTKLSAFNSDGNGLSTMVLWYIRSRGRHLFGKRRIYRRAVYFHH